MALARFFLSAWVLTVFGTALASADTTFTLQLPVLDYSSTSGSSKDESDAEVDTQASSLETAQLAGAYVSLMMDKCMLYFYPFADLKYVSASYMLGESAEIGVDFGINSSKLDKPKSESSSTQVGFFAGYFAPLVKDKINGEYYAFFSQTSTTATDEVLTGTTLAEQKSDTIGTSIKVTAEAVVTLAKNVSYVGGLSYAINAAKDNEAKSSSSSNQLGIRLAAIRMTFP